MTQNRLWKCDPIRYAWEKVHRQELPRELIQSAAERAGLAQGVSGKKGKGKHVLSVCR